MNYVVHRRSTAGGDVRRRSCQPERGMRSTRGGGEILGTSARDDLSAVARRFGPEVDQMIGGAQHVEVVLDDHEGVALVDEAMEGADQALDVGEVQAGRRLVEHEERSAAAARARARRRA